MYNMGAINKNRKRDNVDTIQYSLNNLYRKAKAKKVQMDEIPIQPITWFSHVKLDTNVPFPPFINLVNEMKSFKINIGIIINESISNKGTLVLRYYTRENFF